MLEKTAMFGMLIYTILSLTCFVNGEEPLISAEKAREYDGKMVIVIMKVKATKNFSRKNWYILIRRRIIKAIRIFLLCYPQKPWKH